MSVTRPATQTMRRLPVRTMIAFTPLVVIGMGAAVIGARAHVPDTQIAPGVHVGSLDLSGKTLMEAKPALEQWAGARQSTAIALGFAPDTGITKTWKPDAAKLGLSINVDGTLDAAAKAGRENLVSQVEHVFSGAPVVQVPAVPAADDAQLKAYLKRQIAGDVNRKPKNARFVLIRGGGFGTHHEINGIAVDVDASATAVKQAWTAYLSGGPAPTPGTGQPHPDPAAEAPSGSPATPGGSTTAPGDSSAAPSESAAKPVAAPVHDASVEAALVAKVTPASLTAADLDQINTVLGAKSSYVNGTPARLGNIRIAASHINGTLLKPGDVFSYNRVVGPRDEDEGYRVAPILIRGKHDKGIAGGICQTSGTLFNAVLHSGLQIVQREQHSSPIGYLPIGLDATVSYGSLDFRFRNNTRAPVYVAATLNGRALTFTLFGKDVPGRQVSLVRGAYSRSGARYETQTDRNKPAGYRRVVESGASGCNVTWYRVIKQDGEIVHRDVISSHYSARPGVVLIGTGARKPRPARRAPSGSAAPPAVAPGAGSPSSPDQTNGAPGQ